MSPQDWITIASLSRYAIIAAAVVYVATAITKGMRDVANARREAGQAIAAAHDRNTDAIDRAAEERRSTTPDWAANVKPGDTLVLGFGRVLSMEQADRARRTFEKACPGVNVVIAGPIESMAVKRGDDGRDVLMQAYERDAAAVEAAGRGKEGE